MYIQRVLKDYKIIMLGLTPGKLLEKSLVWVPPRQRKDEYIRTSYGRYLKKRKSVPSDLGLYRTLCNRLDRLPSSRQLQMIAAIKTITAIIWEPTLKDNKTDYSIKWSILTTQAADGIKKRCNLCLADKFHSRQYLRLFPNTTMRTNTKSESTIYDYGLIIDQRSPP